MRRALLAAGVEDPFNLVMERVLSPTEAVCNGRETILLGTYNYMGMTFDPDVIEAGKQALDDFGAGTTGSRVLNGTYAGHRAVEEALKEFYAMDHAMVFSTGYQANLGIISTIAGKGDYIVLDIDSHASIWDGCKMGDAEVVPFKHNDIEAMEKRLKRIPEGAGKLVILEGVYSMLGDIAPLKEMIASPRSTARWCWSTKRIRWASSAPTGAAWPKTRACLDDVDFVIGTFSQVGRHGRRLLRFEPPQVRNPAAGLPPLCLHRQLATQRGPHRSGFDPQADARREQARAPVGKFARAAQGPARCRASSSARKNRKRDHRGDHARSGTRRAMWEALLHEGLYVNLARPPATPANMTLLRCSLRCAEHTRWGRGGSSPPLRRSPRRQTNHRHVRTGCGRAGKAVPISRGDLRGMAIDHDAVFADYVPVLAGPDGGLRPEFGPDGVHPNAAGYAAMRPVAERAIAAAEAIAAGGSAAEE
jgi:8-amino-7-oxononanoate synthase